MPGREEDADGCSEEKCRKPEHFFCSIYYFQQLASEFIAELGIVRAPILLGSAGANDNNCKNKHCGGEDFSFHFQGYLVVLTSNNSNLFYKAKGRKHR